jgi:hypothetical protein
MVANVKRHLTSNSSYATYTSSTNWHAGAIRQSLDECYQRTDKSRSSTKIWQEDLQSGTQRQCIVTPSWVSSTYIK